MTDTAHEDPRTTPKAKIHHLAHLVNAITDQLSTCLSLNSLLIQCRGGARTSETLMTRAESYYTSLNLCQESLKTIAYIVKHQLEIAPGSQEPCFAPGVEGHTRTENGYDSLKVAARECTKVPALLKRIEDQRNSHRAGQWRGWPNCNALEELEDLNFTLRNLRDSGGNSDVGWSVAWKELVDLGIWLEVDGRVWYW